MRLKYWYPTIIGGKIVWLENNGLKFPGIAPDFKFTALEIAEHAKDIEWCIWGYKISMNAEARYHQMVSIKEEILDGDDSMDVIVMPHVSIPMPTSLIKQGAERRIKERMRQIKDDKAKYTEDIGKTLRIIGAEDDFDPNQLVGMIKGINVVEEKVFISFMKKHSDGGALYCKRGAGDFEKVGNFPFVPAEDIRKNLTAEPEERIYKVRCLDHNNEVGHFSSEWRIVVDIH